MKVLHIASWYKTEQKPHNVPFVKEHLDALQAHAENHLIHIEVQDNNQHFFKIRRHRFNAYEEGFTMHTRTLPWRIKEILTWWMLQKILREKKVNKNFDIVNFHISYPLCTYTNWLKRRIQIPMAITEHWTAYALHFGLPKTTDKLDRIKRIFHKNIPLITVSKMLLNSIREFSGNPTAEGHIVPNVVNSTLFKPANDVDHSQVRFFMVNLWRTIKSPFIALDAFKAYLKHHPNAQLRIGGYGPLWTQIEDYVEQHQLANNITLLGRLEKSEVAFEMAHATAFVHTARMETFSVVTAESLLCGTPVIVSNLPAVAEYVHDGNGILVENDSEQVLQAMLRLTANRNQYNRKSISAEVRAKFSKEAVGQRYFEVLQSIVNK